MSSKLNSLETLLSQGFVGKGLRKALRNIIAIHSRYRKIRRVNERLFREIIEISLRSYARNKIRNKPHTY